MRLECRRGAVDVSALSCAIPMVLPSMRYTVNVSAIFDLDRFILVLDESPKLLFHLGLADFDVAEILTSFIIAGYCRTMRLKVFMFESAGSFLKRMQRVVLSDVKSVIIAGP